MPGDFDLRPVIERAILAYDGEAANCFDSAAFAAAVRAEFGVRADLDEAWCAKVLAAEPGVVRFKGHSVWRLAGTEERSTCP